MRYVCNTVADPSLADDARNTASCLKDGPLISVGSGTIWAWATIEGSVQQATFSLWINARLFDAQNGVHAWVDASIATTATFLGTG